MARRGVFKIINKQTGKVYVGSSNTNLDRLLDSYWNKLYSGTHHNRALQLDFDYYGSSNFEYAIVNANCYSEAEVRSVRESEIYLNRFNTYNEDVPVHYEGGNPNASFGQSNRNNARNNHNPLQELFDILNKSNLPQSTKDKIKTKIRIGTINTKAQLQKEINDSKKVSKFSHTQIKKLADEYCNLTEFSGWNRRGNEIVFERRKSFFNSEKIYKSILIYNLSANIGYIKNSFLNSKEYNPQSNKSVKEIAEFICHTLGFDSYGVNGRNCILFDNEYKLCGVKLGEMYELFNKSINFKLGDEDSTISRKLEKTVKTDNFNKKFKDLIFDYIDKRNIQFWDILPNGNILLFDKYLHIITEQQIIKDLDSDYAKLNRKFGSSLLGSVFRLFSNKPAETNPKDELLTILSRSAIPIKAKLEIKNQISYGKIKTKDELKTVIKNSRPKEKAKRRWSKHFKRCRNCGRLVKKDYKVCGSCNYDFKRRKVMPKTDIESDNYYNDGSKAPPGKKICPDCGRIINDYAIRCVSCNHHFKDADDAKYGKINSNTKIESNNQHTSSNVPKNNKICPNCGKEIKQNAIRCKHCNYYFKQGKVLPKNNIKKSKNVSSKNDLKTCPNCGKEINNRAVRCKHCNYYFKQGKVIPKQTYIKKPNDNMQAKRNVKFCSDCHGEINIAATKCIHCGSKSFVYNKNITQLKSFIIKYDMRAEYQWKYIQITYDDEEYIILAKSKAELKQKVVENHLPWDDKKIDTKIPVREGKYYPKQSKNRRGYSGTYYGADYEYDETPSHQYYEKDNYTSQEVLGDDDYYINW